MELLFAVSITIGLFFSSSLVIGEQVGDLTVDELVALNIDNRENASSFAVRFIGQSGEVVSSEDLKGEFSNLTGRVEGLWVKTSTGELFETKIFDVFRIESIKDSKESHEFARVPFPGSEIVLRNGEFELQLWRLTSGGRIGRKDEFRAAATFEPYSGMLAIGEGVYADPIMRLLDPPVAFRNEVSFENDKYKVRSVFGDEAIVTTFDPASNFLISRVVCTKEGKSTEFGVLEARKLPGGSYIPWICYCYFSYPNDEFPRTAHLWTATDIDISPKIEIPEVVCDVGYQLPQGIGARVGVIMPGTPLSPSDLPAVYAAIVSGERFTKKTVLPATEDAIEQGSISSTIQFVFVLILFGIALSWLFLKSSPRLKSVLVTCCIVGSPSQIVADETSELLVYRFQRSCIGLPGYETIEFDQSDNNVICSSFSLLNSPHVLNELSVKESRQNVIEVALKLHATESYKAFSGFQGKGLDAAVRHFSGRRSLDLLEKENEIRSLLTVNRLQRLSQMNEYLVIRQCGVDYYFKLFCNGVQLDVQEWATLTSTAVDLQVTSFEKGTKAWLSTLSKIDRLLESENEVHDWWSSRRGCFERSIYADLICQNLHMEEFADFLGEPLKEKGFPEIFEEFIFLQLGLDGHWKLVNIRSDNSMQTFFNFIANLRQQNQTISLNEFDLSDRQIEELSNVRQQISDEAYVIPDLKQSQYHAIARKHIAHAWDEVLLPRQRDMIVELMRERYRLMVGPLEVLFRPELDEKTKQSIRQEFDRCRKQLLEIEAQLMTDLLNVLKKELDMPNLITGQARPKYLQPSLCLLELHLIAKGQLPRPKNEIEQELQKR